jgi:hypothetical protein
VTAPALDFDPDDDRYLPELAELVAIPVVSRDADPATMPPRRPSSSRPYAARR